MRQPEEILNPNEHCTDISIDEVKQYLNLIKPDIQNNHYTISQENPKNMAFVENTKYIISSEKIKTILLSLTYKNFCWYQKGKKEGDLLFIFRYDGNFIKLEKGDVKEETLILYIKTNKRENRTLVLSFHQSDKPDELVPLF